MHVRTLLKHERGTAIIEMALVLPILLILVIGLVDIARALNYWNDTNQLAGEAARHAAVNRNPGGPDGLTFEQYVRCRAETPEARGPGVTCPAKYNSVQTVEGGGTDSIQSQLVVCRKDGPTTVGEPITIKVQTRYYVMPILRELPGGEGFPSLGLTGEATMRLEQNFDQTISVCNA